MRFSNWKTDKRKEVEGVWVPFSKDCQLLIARFGNERFRQCLEALTAPHRKQIQKGTIDDGVLLDLVKKTASQFILLDWKGLQDDDGKEIPYSHEKALELFCESADFLEEVLAAARERETFAAEQKEESRGN